MTEEETDSLDRKIVKIISGFEIGPVAERLVIIMLCPQDASARARHYSTDFTWWRNISSSTRLKIVRERLDGLVSSGCLEEVSEEGLDGLKGEREYVVVEPLERLSRI